MSASHFIAWPWSQRSATARATTPETVRSRVVGGYVIGEEEAATSTLDPQSDPRVAAFFDLDRTVIRRATPLALANTFRKERVIRRRDLLRALVWQLIFLIRGVEEDAIRRAAEDGMVLLRGVPVAKLEKAVVSAMEDVLRPLVYAEPLALLAEHHERGEAAYVVSASLQEIVDQIAAELGFDGAIGSTCEIVDGIYTGRALRPCYGELKARALRELADRERIDLASSTAYSDSHTDLAFLEAVGHPVAVNPDRRLREIAEARGWPILTFGAGRTRHLVWLRRRATHSAAHVRRVRRSG